MDRREKVRENRLRRMASRQRLVLRKSRRRDPRATDYGTFQLLDFNNRLVLGDRDHGFGRDLDEIEAFLMKEPDARRKR